MDKYASLAINTSSIIDDIEVLEHSLAIINKNLPEKSELRDKSEKALGELPVIKNNLHRLEKETINLYIKKFKSTLS